MTQERKLKANTDCKRIGIKLKINGINLESSLKKIEIYKIQAQKLEQEV